MNLVTVLIVLGVIGMVALGSYERRAKTAEAIGSVTAIAQSAASYYDRSEPLQAAQRHFPQSSQRPVPPSLDMVRGKRYASTANDWAWSPWKELQFSIPQPQYYAYSFNAAGRGAQARATATAQGDLDGDGEESMYLLSVSPDTSLHAVVAPTIEQTAPEE